MGNIANFSDYMYLLITITYSSFPHSISNMLETAFKFWTLTHEDCFVPILPLDLNSAWRSPCPCWPISHRSPVALWSGVTGRLCHWSPLHSPSPPCISWTVKTCFGDSLPLLVVLPPLEVIRAPGRMARKGTTHPDDLCEVSHSFWACAH